MPAHWLRRDGRPKFRHAATLGKVPAQPDHRLTPEQYLDLDGAASQMPGMTSDEFRRLGHEVVDWIADYLVTVRDLPVLPSMQPGDFASQLPREGPQSGEPMERVLADFRSLVLPAVTHWNHPRFLSYFAISGSEPGILGEMIATALNVNGFLWVGCPAATELEQVTLDWLRQWLGLPAGLFGILHDTASTSTLHAIVAAREYAAPESRETGDARALTIYCSE